MMPKKSIESLSKEDINGKRIFVRVDFNTPIHDNVVQDDSRIVKALPTIRYLSERGAKVILATHLGRPKGEVCDEFRLTPVQKRLSELLEIPIIKTEDCIGEDVHNTINNMKNGDVILLENTRFYKEETDNDKTFAKALSELADIVVLDAFGTAHRAHASTYGIGQYLPTYAGLLMKKELQFLGEVVENSPHPFVAIIGGSKVSSKIGVLKHLLKRVDTLIIGGGMVFTFLKAQGISIGKSLVENDKIDEAKQFLEAAKQAGKRVVFPSDQVVATTCDENAETEVVLNEDIPSDKMGLDIGPNSIKEIKDIIKEAKTIMWNGPMGVFEIDQFATGTNEVAQAIADNQEAITIVGGGDSVAAVRKAHLETYMSHISTGGGASLEFLEGKELPGVSIILEEETV